jgi:hypothetical protein
LKKRFFLKEEFQIVDAISYSPVEVVESKDLRVDF